jgi:integrase/uncharacterized Zn finger protein (UPF0148 family)
MSLGTQLTLRAINLTSPHPEGTFEMVDVNDPSGYEAQKRRAEENFKEAEINEKDKKAVLAMYNLREANGSYAASTQATLLVTLKRVCELTHKPVVEWKHTPYESDYTTFVTGVRDGTLEAVPEGGYSTSYVGNMKRVLSVFLNHLGKEWNEDIPVGQPSDGEITEKDCFTSDETARLFSNTNVRDSAVLAVWLATGQRLTAMASIKAEDVKIEGNSGGFYLNPEAIGLKGAEGYRPLLWSTPYVARWIDGHPTYPDEDPEAALFVCERGGRDYDIGDPLGKSGYTKLLRRACKRAGTESHKAKTHRLRHTAIRRMIRDGLSDQWIKYMVGWGEDSPQLARYGSLEDETKAKDIENHYGISSDEDDDKHLFENCPSCSTPVSQLTNARFCPSCGLSLKHDGQKMERVIDGRMWDSRGEGNEQANRGVDVAKKILENPDAKNAVMEELKDELMADMKDELDL